MSKMVGQTKIHKAVLLNETVHCLNVRPNKNFIDATLGAGGHAEAILEHSKPNGIVLAFEKDPVLAAHTAKRLRKLARRLIVCREDYAGINEAVLKNKIKKVSGVLYDLGLSSWHLEQSGRGFSFQKDEPLDMRFNPEQSLTASEIINKYPLIKLKEIFKNYGEERNYIRVAEAIIDSRRHRPLKTTGDLLKAIAPVVAHGHQKGKIHFATKTFQALRIAVNNELGSLSRSLPQSLRVLEKGGRMAIITFNSLEAREVKKFFAENKNKLRIVKKSVRPSRVEIRDNPRARSATLRICEKI